MQRVSNSSKKSNLFGAGKHGFTDGSPGVEAATVLDSAVMNAHQEEVARAVEGFGGTTLDSGNLGQLDLALRTFKARTHFAAESVQLTRPDRLSSGSQDFTGFAADGVGMIIACGEGGTCARSSTLGRTWSAVASGSGFTGNYVQCAAGMFSGGSYKACVGGDNIQSSAGVGALVQRVSGGGTMLGIAYGDTQFVVAASDGLYLSTDGFTFSGPSNPPNVPASRLWFGGDVIGFPLFMGIASGGSAVVAGTPTGGWVLHSMPGGHTVRELSYGGGRWWALTTSASGTKANLLSSKNAGGTWVVAATSPTIGFATPIFCAALPAGGYAGYADLNSTAGLPGLAGSNTDVTQPGWAQLDYSDKWISAVRPLDTADTFVLLGTSSAAGSILCSHIISSVY